MTCFPCLLDHGHRALARLGVRQQMEHTPKWRDSRTLTALRGSELTPTGWGSRKCLPGYGAPGSVLVRP